MGKDRSKIGYKSGKMKSEKVFSSTKHRHHKRCRMNENSSSSKLISKPINKMMAKTGSYDLTNSINSINVEDVLNINNDKIRLNSAEPINDITDTMVQLESINHRFDNPIVKPDNLFRNDEHLTNTPASRSSLAFEFPKKKRCLGMPLICFTYFAAIYSILAYGATSLLSLFEVMTNNSTRLIPLYILLIGYLLITLLTFVLIIAIQKELLNLILLWCIVMTVFILPEIGLNIMLAENTFNWFESTSGFYTLIALVLRVLLDIPCICLVLAYHRDRCKRVNLLRKIMMPLRKNISSGEILRSYNDIGQRQSFLGHASLPQVTRKAEKRESTTKGSIQKSNEIGFEKLEGQLMSEYGIRNSQDEILNRIHYKFAPNRFNYEIILRPSQTGEFLQKFVNVNEVKFDGRDEERIMLEVPANAISSRKYSRRKSSRKESDKEGILEKNGIKKENIPYILNDNEFKEKYINEITKKSRMINLASHQIYLPSSASSLVTNPKLVNNFMPLNSELSINLDLTNETIVDLNNQDSKVEYSLNPSCECVNIVSCGKEEMTEFLHSDECPIKTQQPTNDRFMAPTLLMATQRKHF